ncbi:MAG: hypothetical protein ABMA64_34730 [Myxococcota bacterium]
MLFWFWWAWSGCAHRTPNDAVDDPPPVPTVRLELASGDLDRLSDAIEDIEIDCDSSSGSSMPVDTQTFTLGPGALLRVWPATGAPVEFRVDGFVTGRWSSVSRILMVRAGPEEGSDEATRVVSFVDLSRWELFPPKGEFLVESE